MAISKYIVFVNVEQELLEKHPEGRYHISHNGSWVEAGTDALAAGRITLAAAAEKYGALRIAVAGHRGSAQTLSR